MKRTILPRPPLRYNMKVRVTWLRSLLASESKCEWALWFLRRYDVPDEDSPELQEWNAKHGAMLEKRVAELKNRGLTVTKEDENTLIKHGKNSRTIMRGKPDIAIHEPDRLIYEDCKTGKRRYSDHVQILLYAQLYAQTRKPELRKLVEGVVVYSGAASV